MSSKAVTVGIWQSAPFKGAIYRGIDRVNEFLKEQKLDIFYEGVSLDENKLPVSRKIPDILFLDGGEDINPRRYGETNRYSHFSNFRDAAEFKLVDYFYNYGKRMSGVCRGHQVLNVYFGGKLYQDLYNDKIMHPKYLASHRGGHKVRVKRVNRYPLYLRDLEEREQRKYKKQLREKRGHVVGRFVGPGPFTVSSMHHQAVKHLGNSLGVSLVFGHTKNAPHFIIEGIESADSHIRGVQSHPEFNGYPKDGVLFSYLLHVDNFVDGIIEPDIDAVEARLKIKQEKAKMPFDAALMAKSRRHSGERDNSPFNPPETGRIATSNDSFDSPVIIRNTGNFEFAQPELREEDQIVGMSSETYTPPQAEGVSLEEYDPEEENV